MTSDIVIRAEELGKKYWIGHRTERQQDQNLRDVFARNLSQFWTRHRGHGPRSSDYCRR